MSHYFETNHNLKNKPTLLKYELNEERFIFKTNSGVFSRSGIDFGSDLLVTNFIEHYKAGNILDLGCGYGFIGIVLSKILSADVDMVDINQNAVGMARENIVSNNIKSKAYLSNGFENVSGKYDYIISNPPIRIGKEAMYQLLFEALKYLKKDGELWLVVRKEQGAKSLIKDFNINYKTEVVYKKSGFYIIKVYIA